MTADHLSYKRATTVSLIGLAIQAVLGVVMLIYARLASDSAGLTGALAMLLGLPIWTALALVFHQHRLERLEALEADAYAASSAAQASVFEEAGGADTQAQARRLAWMHKWFLPSMSLLVGAALLGVGAIRFLQTRGEATAEAALKPPAQPGWAISIGVGVAIVGFIFARFVAGMAKQRVWALLHAGSAAAVGSALIGAAMVVAHFLMVATRSDTLLRYLAPALSVYMAALGAEMFLNLVLNLYRPRKAGEYQRPAFDSRVLAFVAAPDRLAESISDAINYQFGFNVSATWFYQLLARSLGSLLILGLLTLWAMSVFTVVKPQERGLLLRNGRLVREVGPGLVIDWPWPWSSVERFPADAVNEINVGTPRPTKNEPILWTNDHSPDEKFMLVQPPRASVGGPGDSSAKSGDLNLLSAEVPINYIVTDLVRYKRLAQDGPRGKEDQMRRELLTAAASGVVSRYMATLDVDQILGAERRFMSERIRALLQKEFDERLDAGVKVIFTGVSGVHPHKDVAPAFEAVVAADQKRRTAVETAEADAIRALAQVVGDVDRAKAIIAELNRLDALQGPGADAGERISQEQRVIDLIVSAGGDAAALISQAKAERWEKHFAARGRAAASEGQIASYRAAPQPYRVARYYEALREAARSDRVYIVPPRVRVRINQEEQEPVISAFSPAPEAVK